MRIKYIDRFIIISNPSILGNFNKMRMAVPDFYIPSTNTIVEIKSEYTLNEQEMKDKAKQYIQNGYNFKLLVDFIDRTELVLK